MRGQTPCNASWHPVWIHSLTEHLILDKPRLESFETPAVSFWVVEVEEVEGTVSWQDLFYTGCFYYPLANINCAALSHGHDLVVSEIGPGPWVRSAGRRWVPPAGYLKHLPPDIRIERIHYKSTLHPISQGAHHHSPTPTQTHPAQTACIL